MSNFNFTPLSWRRGLRLFAAASALLSLSQQSFAVEPLSVSGNQVLMGGQQGSVAGNSLFWSNNGWGGEKYYTAGTVGWLKSDWKSGLVRAAMGVEDPGGYFDDPVGNEAKVRSVVEAAIANDMYVIIDWHSHYANTHDWSRARSFFQRMARDYGHTNNVIYEIFNEPKQVSWSADVKPYAESVIAAIRAEDPDNLIVVGTPSWSQDVDHASADPITGFSNIAYTLHFYAGTHKQFLRDKAQTALNNGIALFATEWGTVNADGDGGVNHGETDAWMAFLKTNNISHANWAINDKAEGSSALMPGASGDGGWASLTESGTKVKDILLSWDGVTPPPPPPECARVQLPARIQAEAYCQMQGVQLEASTDVGGGQNVGYVDAGDWMTYEVNVPSAGQYQVAYRVASNIGGGVVQLEQGGGAPIFGSVAVGNTGGWQAWQTVTHEVALSAGDQTLALSAPAGDWNINWFEITPVSGCANNCPVSSRIEAEQYASQLGVQTEATTDVGGGQNVGWLDADDWMQYDVNLPAGSYQVSYRLASEMAGASFRLEGANGALLNTVAAPNTGGWQNWQTLVQNITLSAAQQSLKLYVVNGPFNINWIEFLPQSQPAVDTDGDGVADTVDQCPGTPLGTAVDASGCALQNPGSACEGVPAYPNWLHNDYEGGAPTHMNAGDEMQHNGQLFRANWYTSSVPGSDATWSFVSDC